jgi:hypothetical protein
MREYTKQRTVCYTDEELNAVKVATSMLGMELNAFIRWASVNTARHVLNQPHAYIGRRVPANNGRHHTKMAFTAASLLLGIGQGHGHGFGGADRVIP